MHLSPRLAESRAARAFHRYRSTDLEYPALKVVGRGLFLAVILMLALLFVFAQVTDLIAGENEVLIPTTSVDSSVDLGQIVRGAFTRTSGAVFSIVGVITLVASSYLTARALRTGTRRALVDPHAKGPRWRDPRTIGLAIAVPALVLAIWLLTLGTTIRRAAWSELVGMQLPDAGVNAAKAGAVILQLVLVTAAAALAFRAVRRSWPRLPELGAFLALAGLAVAANFFLLYTYVGALLNPQVSAGIVLIFTLLLWVNIVVRAYLGTLAWIAVGRQP